MPLMVKADARVHLSPTKSIVALLTLIESSSDSSPMESAVARETVRGGVKVAISTAFSLCCMTRSTIRLGMLTVERPTRLSMIETLLVKLYDHVISSKVLSVAEVTVNLTPNTPMIPFRVSNPAVDVSMAISTFRGLSDVNVITVTLPTLVRAVKVSVNFRKGICAPSGASKAKKEIKSDIA